jgi:ArsR family transcriptional regulator
VTSWVETNAPVLRCSFGISAWHATDARLMERLGASQSRMSRHMATLKIAGLVTDRRDAQWVRYRRAPHLPEPVATLIQAALSVPLHPERIAA